MTSFINGTMGLPVTIHAGTDMRHGDEFYFANEDLFFPQSILLVDMETENEVWGFSTPWWPGPNLLGIGFEGLADIAPLGNPLQGEIWYSLGANGRLAFSGITRDQYGSPMANCTVRCIRTATDELVSKVSSDANGAYIATTPYNDAHFLVVHSSDGTRGGATVNTALPA